MVGSCLHYVTSLLLVGTLCLKLVKEPAWDGSSLKKHCSCSTATMGVLSWNLNGACTRERTTGMTVACVQVVFSEIVSQIPGSTSEKDRVLSTCCLTTVITGARVHLCCQCLQSTESIRGCLKARRSISQRLPLLPLNLKFLITLYSLTLKVSVATPSNSLHSNMLQTRSKSAPSLKACTAILTRWSGEASTRFPCIVRRR